MIPNTLRVGNRTYRIEVDSAADGWFGVAFADAAGCVALGPTLEVALRYAKAKMTDWIAYGGTPSEPTLRRGLERVSHSRPEFVERITWRGTSGVGLR
jgi:predicted RNase H-like HicB family nuclease